MVDPFRLVAVDHPLVPRTLRGRLAARVQKLSDDIGTGVAVDYADYQRRVGVCHGLMEAIQICEQVEKEQE